MSRTPPRIQGVASRRCFQGWTWSLGLCVVIAGGTMPAASTHAGCSIREALGMIESGNDDRAVGRAGEISRYQIKKNIWRKFSASQRYWDKDMAWRIAGQVLATRAAEYLRQTGRDPEPFDLYVLWNAPGQFQMRGYERKRISRVVAERAERFANLVRQSTPTLTADVARPPRGGLLLAGSSSVN